MKQPRIEDFDPNAKTRTLKSSLDNMPSIEKQPNSPIIKTVKDRDTDSISTPVPPNPVPYPSTPYGVSSPVPLNKRKMKQRQPFDIYEDQYEKLKKIAEDERNQGLPGSMSRMVREGIDMYLTAREIGDK